MLISMQLFLSAFDTKVASGYYEVDNPPVPNSVDVNCQAPCSPSRMFSDCINMTQNQGCSDGLLASVACPGKQDIIIITIL